MIQIVDWDKHFENNRTRDMVKTQWVPIPNRLDGDGYTELISHQNGPAHFGAWCSLLAVASRCGVRGTLLRDSGQPHDAASLERITRIPVEIWESALPRLVTIGWITGYEIPQEGAGIPQAPAMKEGRKEGRKGRVPGSPETVPFESIVQHLNAKTGRGFKAKNKTTISHIRARWNEGWGLDDFKAVVDANVKEWGSDPKMARYLRPETLFGTKFESYLQVARAGRVVKIAERHDLGGSHPCDLCGAECERRAGYYYCPTHGQRDGVS